MVKPIVVSILADARGARKGVQETEGLLSRLGGAAKRYGKIAAAGVAAAATAIIVSSVGLASEAEQSIGATEQIYGKYADGVVSKSRKAAMEVGLSANSYRELSNGLGAMLKNAGTPMDQLAGKTDNLVTLGADLAATFGGSTSDAVAAIGSLMRGEANPIEKYGVAIKQSDVNARLAAQGLKGLTGEKLREAEATARLELLYQQTADAQGQFGRESSTLAGQQQRLSAQWEDMRVSLGTKLLPVLTMAFEWLNTYAPKAWEKVELAADKLEPVLSNIGGVLSGVWDIFSKVASIIGDNVAIIGVLGAGYLAYKAITLGVAAAEWAVYLWQSRSVLMGAAKIAVTNGMAVAQRGLNAAMKANPLGLVIGLITLLIAAAVWAYKNVDWFREGVQKAFAGIVAAGKWLWEGIKWAWDKITAAAGLAGKLIMGYLGLWVSAFKFVIQGGKDLYSNIAGIVGKVTAKFSEVKSKVVGVFKGAGSWLYNAGKNIVTGLLNGVGSLAKTIGSWFIDKLPGWIQKPFKAALGIKSPSREFAKDGAYLVQGLIVGIDSEAHKLRAAMGETAGLVASAFSPELPSLNVQAVRGNNRQRLSYDGPLADRSAAAGGVTNIYITVDVPIGASKVEVGREIKQALDAYYTVGGRL